MKTIRVDLNLDYDQYQNELNDVFGDGVVNGEESFFEANQALEISFSDDGRFLGVKAVTFDGKVQ